MYKLKYLYYEWILLNANFWGCENSIGFIDNKRRYTKNKFMDWEVTSLNVGEMSITKMKIIKNIWNIWNDYCHSSIMIFTMLFFIMVITLIRKEWIAYSLVCGIIITRFFNWKYKLNITELKPKTNNK